MELLSHLKGVSLEIYFGIFRKEDSIKAEASDFKIVEKSFLAMF